MLLLLAVLCLGVLVDVALRFRAELSSPPEGAAQTEAQLSAGNVADSPQQSSLPNMDAELIVSLGPATGDTDGDLRHRVIEKQIAELQWRVGRLEAEKPANRRERSTDTATPQDSIPPSQASRPTGEAKLVAAGIDSRTAAWIQQQLDKNQLDELYLQNQASREGWLNTPRYHQAHREIQARFNELRGQLGDETFDKLLYALGRPNRVLISDVLQGSPAQQTGLNAHDEIVFYDGKRVFSTQELQGLTSEGDTSLWVLMEVRRDGEPLGVYVPGGPLGVRLATGHVPPR